MARRPRPSAVASPAFHAVPEAKWPKMNRTNPNHAWEPCTVILLDGTTVEGSIETWMGTRAYFRHDGLGYAFSLYGPAAQRAEVAGKMVWDFRGA